MKQNKELHVIRAWLLAFMILLFLSGLTAIPIERELALLLQLLSAPGNLHNWLLQVHGAYQQVEQEHPFLLYGYDWLAFAHFILAILFIEQCFKECITCCIIWRQRRHKEFELRHPVLISDPAQLFRKYAIRICRLPDSKLRCSSDIILLG